MTVFSLPYGQQHRLLTIPGNARWTELVYDGAEAVVDRDEDCRRIRTSLQSPIDAPRLQHLARGRRSAVILISDSSRLAPSSLILPELVRELNAAGMPDEALTIIVALGMHRKATDDELRSLAGEEVFRRIRIINHSSLPDDCTYVGTTSRGTPIAVLQVAVQADLRIAVGNIEPHGLAGFSGGAKALVPGIAAQPTIEAHHSLSLRYPPAPGQVDHPLRLDLEEALGFCPLHFIVNVVVNHRGSVLGAYAGDPVSAHRAGAEMAKNIYMVLPRRTFDLVIASAGGHPKDIQLYQAIKSLQNASHACKEGGSIVLAAKCGELFGNGIFQYWTETIQDRSRMVQMLNRKFVLGAHKIRYIDDILNKHQVYLHSDIPRELTALIGFTHCDDVQETFDRLLTEHPEAETAVIPYASLTFPRTDD